MSNLTDAQRVILSAAARRADGAILPLTKALRINKGAATSVLKSLLKRSFVAERPAAKDDIAWREIEAGNRITLIITDAGLKAIGAERSVKATKPSVPTKQAKMRDGHAGRPTVNSKLKAEASPPAVQNGTKQSLLINLLNRKNGATIAEAASAWLAGALGAWSDQRRAQEEARPRHPVRNRRRPWPRLSDRRRVLKWRIQSRELTPCPIVTITSVPI